MMYEKYLTRILGLLIIIFSLVVIATSFSNGWLVVILAFLLLAPLSLFAYFLIRSGSFKAAKDNFKDLDGLPFS